MSQQHQKLPCDSTQATCEFGATQVDTLSQDPTALMGNQAMIEQLEQQKANLAGNLGAAGFSMALAARAGIPGAAFLAPLLGGVGAAHGAAHDPDPFKSDLSALGASTTAVGTAATYLGLDGSVLGPFSSYLGAVGGAYDYSKAEDTEGKMFAGADVLTNSAMLAAELAGYDAAAAGAMTPGAALAAGGLGTVAALAASLVAGIKVGKHWAQDTSVGDHQQQSMSDIESFIDDSDNDAIVGLVEAIEENYTMGNYTLAFGQATALAAIGVASGIDGMGTATTEYMKGLETTNGAEVGTGGGPSTWEEPAPKIWNDGTGGSHG